MEFDRAGSQLLGGYSSSNIASGNTIDIDMKAGNLYVISGKTTSDSEYFTVLCTATPYNYQGQIVWPVAILASEIRNITVEGTWWGKIRATSDSGNNISFVRLKLFKGFD